ncbi:polysaccharide deacetylase family protein [Paludisphaera mucosa]|uniref:Polysaccharide deacetylase family protein n=1 Tax=Paludisphaera mucosa TaxID=3030827 RepID=A0ABT6FJA2_9BACT|nr:polysaccharide deacetylase family protein [Paludisphaera mucosa]MDG3007657.1 polysaccharide deacetylase family protein [Paludisphaera mucosa]
MGRRFWDSVANKRAFLARGLVATGAARAFEAVREASGRAVVVLTYHRIAEPGPGNPYYDPVVSATPAGFRAQMAMLRDRFQIVGPEDLVADEVRVDRRPRAVVTFDDGYRDNHDAALPILGELGIPATFFIPTGFFERPGLPWWDHVAYVVKASRRGRFAVERSADDPAPIAVELGGPDRSAAIMRLVRAVLDGEVPDRAWFLGRLEERAEVDVDPPTLGRALFMGWEHLAELADLGHTIGSHAHGHVALGTLDDRALRRELALSRTILEAAVKRPVRTIAYPYGWPGAVDDRTYRLAAAAGYRAGFTASEGIVRPDLAGFDPLAMPRLTVGGGDTPALLRTRAALWGAVGRSWL